MTAIHFEWDEGKNQTNIREHEGISFVEAKTVFFDPNARVIYDPDHSIDEDRYVILGLSNAMRLLIVCHCYRENDEIIRIFSARKAGPKEIKQYGGNK
jgi:uncharacterized DUF497 family protein